MSIIESNIRTTLKDSVDDFMRLSQRGARISEVLNPRITCESSFIEKRLDTEGVLCDDGFVSGDVARLDP